jgi:6-phosphogluconolactonase
MESPGAQSHAIVLSPDRAFAFVPAKGADRVGLYHFDPGAGTLTANTPPSVASASGAGPRHIAFHPSAPFAYVINELDSTMTAYGYDTATGVLSPIESESTLPVGFSGNSTGAEVQVSPSGKFVYGSNRPQGEDGTLVVFRTETDGRLTHVTHVGTRGRIPRHFSLTPDGAFALVANQDSSSVVVFRADADTGALSFATEIDVGVSPFFVGAFDVPLP